MVNLYSSVYANGKKVQRLWEEIDQFMCLLNDGLFWEIISGLGFDEGHAEM